MKIQNNPISSLAVFRKSILLLVQFFLIIVVYHTLKDLKDTVVITASDAGAEVIPFIKIWGMLPASVGASYLFANLYNRFGREKTLYIFVSFLVTAYILFAAVLYPHRDVLYLSSANTFLTATLPEGCKGLIAMISYWHYTLFYLTAELWSPLILSVLFWGYVNETTSLAEAKKFYPICMITGNCAGIFSGQASHWLCNDLRVYFSWEETMQWLIGAVAICCFLIMVINYRLARTSRGDAPQQNKKAMRSHSFKDNLVNVFRTPHLLCIAVLVVSFALTTNLIEVVWKESILSLHPDPHGYNAYINRLTSITGILAVFMAILSRWLFQWLNWSTVALITPTLLFITSSLFFAALLVPFGTIDNIAYLIGATPLVIIVTCGSIHYVLAMTAKYTLFDTSKEMAFLTVDLEERTRGKSIIDSIGSRFGKSGSSCLYQVLLVLFGSASGHISIIGVTSIAVIACSIVAARKLGNRQIENTTTQGVVV